MVVNTLSNIVKRPLTTPGEGDLGKGDFDFFDGIKDSFDFCLTGVLGFGVLRAFPSGTKGGGATSGTGGRDGVALASLPPFVTMTFLNSSLTDLERFGRASSPWRLELRPGTENPVFFGGGTSGLSGLGGLSGFCMPLGFATGLGRGEGVPDLACWNVHVHVKITEDGRLCVPCDMLYLLCIAKERR